MGIAEKRALFGKTAKSGIGSTILGIIKTPFEFTRDVVSIPFDFVQGTVSGVTTKVVMVAGLLILGVYVIGKYGVLKDVAKLK
jgi:hypothetical protein